MGSNRSEAQAVAYNGTSSLPGRAVSGGIWTFASRAFFQALNFLKMIILARVLLPEDFGIIGIAFLMMAILEAFSQTGFRQALVQKKENVSEYLDVAWTLLAIRGFLIFGVLVLAAPLMAQLMSSHEAEVVIRVIALSAAINGFVNIGMVFFQKELEFRKQFKFDIVTTSLDFSITLGIIAVWQSYWAIAIGTVAGAMVRLVSSYIFHPYRPHFRLDMDKARELTRFGKWVFISSIVLFIITQGDDLYVGAALGAAALGIYQMAFRLASVPATEIAQVITQVTFPAFSKLQSDAKALKASFYRVLQISSFVSFPIAGLILVCAEDFISLVLGPVWLPMVPIVQVLCIFGIARGIGSTNDALFMGMGQPKYGTYVALIKLILLLPLLYILTHEFGIIGTAMATTIPMFFSHAYGISKICQILDSKARDYIAALAPPTIGVILMVLVSALIQMWQFEPIMSLVITATSALLTYIVFCYLASSIAKDYDVFRYTRYLIKTIR